MVVNGKRVRTPENSSWHNMKVRVKDSSRSGYKYQMDMDPRWEEFEAFFADMGNRPFHDATLERKDGHRGYWPDNCEWASRKTQCRNRDCVHLSLDDAKQIRDLYATGHTQVQIARMFKTCHSHVGRIVRHMVWT